VSVKRYSVGTGEVALLPMIGPKPRKRMLGRIKRMLRRVSLHRAKKAGHKASRRQFVRQLRLSKLHARLANIRKDAAHKLTTDLSRRFETIVIEDLNVSGMAKDHSLAGAVLDCGFHEIRRQFQYKQAMRGGRVVLADRFYPSTQICSCCGCFTGPKAVRKCMSKNGVVANAAPRTRVTATPQST
jgi:putative transposase